MSTDKKVSICMIVLEKEEVAFFNHLLLKALSECESLQDRVKLLNNRLISDLSLSKEEELAEREEIPILSLKMYFDAIVAGEEEDGDYQAIINLIGELIAEAVEKVPDPLLIVCPDLEYGTALEFHRDFFDTRMLTIDEALLDYYKDPSCPLKQFGVIGDYGIISAIASEEGADNSDSAPGRHLPYSEYESLFEKLAVESEYDRKELEQEFVNLVIQLDAKYRLCDEKVVMIGSVVLERFLLGYRPYYDYGHPLVKHVPNRESHNESFWDRYEAVWQAQVKCFYDREDWPKGLKLHSLLTDYARRIIEIVETLQ